MTTFPNRRRFLKSSAGLAAAGYFVSMSSAQPADSPNERLRIAGVGVTNRAGANLRGVASQDIVAVADVDADLLEQGSQPYPQARKYRDFREMLDREADRIDAVVVGCPDHTHAAAAAMALRLKKHVYCEKPLTHTVREARILQDLAAEHQLVTQMGTQIHAGENYRHVVELIRAGAIGAVERVHVWVNVQWTGAQRVPAPVPPQLDWDLWQGPAAETPYSAGIHPFEWRRFWDYGNGGLGDFGCHYMDLVHWALDLRHPTRIEARGPEVDPVSTPAWLECDYHYPSRGDQPAVHLTWYDGGRRPEILSELRDAEGQSVDWVSGHLFVGSDGLILSDYGRHWLFRDQRFSEIDRPEPSIARSIGHHEEWLQAIRSGGSTTCSFDYSGPLTEAVLLGGVAYRSGQPIEWDAERMRIRNAPELASLLHKEYRSGWEL